MLQLSYIFLVYTIPFFKKLHYPYILFRNLFNFYFFKLKQIHLLKILFTNKFRAHLNKYHKNS